jgi:hypothetical protein
MGKIIRIADGHDPAIAGGFLVVCVPGNAPPTVSIVGGPWELVYGVGTDNWPRLRVKLRKDHPGKDIYVVGAPAAPTPKDGAL